MGDFDQKQNLTLLHNFGNISLNNWPIFKIQKTSILGIVSSILKYHNDVSTYVLQHTKFYLKIPKYLHPAALKWLIYYFTDIPK